MQHGGEHDDVRLQPHNAKDGAEPSLDVLLAAVAHLQENESLEIGGGQRTE
jgi:hypothetical protein